ncbi:MAG TPA: CHRD domain-containing protein [Gemmatimonadota bacterium]|nr:CHRD domain-containing protein [Gemmatimonadota bacterium]
MTRSTRIFAVLALLGAFVLGACQQGTDEGELEEPITDETGMPDVPDLGEEEALPAEVGLEAKAESGITGTATVLPAADGVEIALDLNGLTAGQTYASHLHRGTCDNDGGVVAPLEDIVADGETARVTTTVGESMLDPSAGSLFIQVHVADGTPVACGDIPAEADITGMSAPGAGEYDEPATGQTTGEYQP